ncbi:MAG: AI-2E family transporter [Chloroflexi bacterium]|nr:AI-2E family transporter [Chloroflexota bacterium]
MNDDTSLAKERPHPETESAVAYSRQAWGQFSQRIKSITPSALARILLVMGGLSILVWLAKVTWPALAPFALGAAVAYVLLPVVNWLDRFLPRAVAVLLTLAAVLLVIGVIIAQLAPIISEQINIIYQNIPDEEELAAIEADLLSRLDTLPGPTRIAAENYLQGLVNSTNNNLDEYASNMVDITVSAVTSLINTIGFVLGFLVIPAWLLDVLRDNDSGIQVADRALPGWLRPDFWAIVRIIDRPFRAFLQGQVVLAIAAGVGIFLGASVLEVVQDITYRYKLLAVLIVVFFQLIPIIGPIVSGIILILLALLLGTPQGALIVLLLHIGVQMLVNTFVAPSVERRFVNIHPALLVMVIVLLSEFGLIWIMFAAPITAVIRDLYRYVYGRVSDPPLPAGALPGEPMRILPHSTLFSPFVPAQKERVPLTYRRIQNHRRSRTQQQEI